MNIEDIKKNKSYLAHLILNSYLSVAKAFGASKKNRMVIAMDSKPSWRHHYYLEHADRVPGYKGRKYKGSREKDDSIPWGDYYAIFDEVHEFLRKHSDFDVIKVDLAEGDDIVAIAAKMFKETERVYIVGSDKDFKQLQDEPRVVQYDPVKKIFVPRLDPEFHLQKHIIMGDGADEIDAIKPRCGHKTAEKMVKDIDRLLATNAEMRTKHEFNKTLIDFQMIPESLQVKIQDALLERTTRYDMMSLSELCSKHGLRKIFERVREFSLPEETPKTKLNSYLEDQMSAKSENALDEFFS